jgi:signal peptidase II
VSYGVLHEYRTLTPIFTNDNSSQSELGLQMQAATLLLTAILLIGLDQVTKALVIYRLQEGKAVSFGAFVIRMVRNQRACGGAATLTTAWVLLLVFVQFGPFFKNAVAPVALGVALGGASSNLLDRLSYEGVIDFIDVGFWPVFNLADVAIITGAMTAVLYI